MGNSPLSGQGVSEAHDRDVKGVESTDERPNKLAEEIRVDSSNSIPSHPNNSALHYRVHCDMDWTDNVMKTMTTTRINQSINQFI